MADGATVVPPGLAKIAAFGTLILARLPDRLPFLPDRPLDALFLPARVEVAAA